MAAPSFVKASAIANVTSGTAASTFTGGNTALNLIIVYAFSFGSSVASMLPFLSDTAGDTYIQAGITPAGGVQTALLICSSCKGGANTVNLTQPTGSTRWGLTCFEYTPGQGATDVVVQHLDSGTSMAVTLAPTKDNELIVWASSRTSGPVTFSGLTAGYTQRQQNNTQFYVDNAGASSVAGSQTVNATASVAWSSNELAIAILPPSAGRFRTLVGVGA